MTMYKCFKCRYESAMPYQFYRIRIEEANNPVMQFNLTLCKKCMGKATNLDKLKSRMRPVSVTDIKEEER